MFKIKVACIALLMTSGVSYADEPNVILADDENFEKRWNWTGFSAGLEIGFSNQVDETEDPTFGVVATANGSGDVYGVFVGYNHQFGNFVAGVEGSYHDYSNRFTDGSGVVIEDIWAVKARAGYAMGRLHAYGLFGFAHGTTSAPVDFLVGGDFGMVWGAGIDVAVTDNIFIGAQYNHHQYNDFADLDLTALGLPDAGINAQMDTYSFRVGYKF